MSWLGWLFILAAIYVVVVVIRGAIQFTIWLVEEHFRAPDRIQHRDAVRKAIAQPRSTDHNGDTSSGKADPSRSSAPSIPLDFSSTTHSSSWLARHLRHMGTVLVPKTYDRWVAAALEETDPKLKIVYLTKALTLDPSYRPGWGLKGNLLLSLKRYAEAADCFDRSLAIHPSASIWCAKGKCYLGLGNRDEALRCLRETIKTCPREDRELLEEATSLKRQLETVSSGAGAA